MLSTKKYSHTRVVALTTILRLSAAVFSVGILSTMGSAATGLEVASLQRGAPANEIESEAKSRLPIMLDRDHYQQNRDNVKCYINEGGDPNLTFPDRVGSGAHDWSLLCVCVARNDVEAINVLRERGADANYQNDLGVTPLHLAAYLGHEDVVRALFHPIGSNVADPTLTDNHGLLPGDYLRIALEENIHGAFGITSILDSAEEIAFRRKKGESTEIRNFVTSFVDHCSSFEMSQRALLSRSIARSGSILSASSIISLLGDVVPGPSIAFSAASAVASAVEDHLADQSTRRAVSNLSNLIPDTDRVFRNLAHFLGTLYGNSINELTPEAAEKFGKYGADKVSEYIDSIESSDQSRQNQSFSYQVREYFSTLETDTSFIGKVKSSVTKTTLRKKDGSHWGAKYVLREGGQARAQIQTREWVVDGEEENRLRRLMSSPLDTRISQLEVASSKAPASVGGRGSMLSAAIIRSEEKVSATSPQATAKTSASNDENKDRKSIGNITGRSVTEESKAFSKSLLSQQGGDSTYTVTGDGNTVGEVINGPISHTFNKR